MRDSYINKDKAKKKKWVCAYYEGETRRRKSFFTKDEAEDFRAEKNKKTRELGSHSTYGEDQIAEWALLQKEADSKGVSLREALDGWTAHLARVTEPTPLGEAVELYLATITKKATREPAKNKLARWVKHCGGDTLIDRAALDVLRYLNEMKTAPKKGGGTYSPTTIANHRLAISGLLSWAVTSGRVAENKLLDPKNTKSFRPSKGKEVSVLKISEVVTLLEYIMHDFDLETASFYLLQLFTGIRPQELMKDTDEGWIHLTWANVLTDYKDAVHVPVHMTKSKEDQAIKTRRVKREPVLVAWLEWLQEKHGAPLCGNILTDGYEVEKWRNNHQKITSFLKHRDGSLLRHTYASFYYAKTSSFVQTAKHLGNSESICKQKYTNVQDWIEESCNDYWSLTPKKIIEGRKRELKVI